jgi:hypothetical protein
MSQPKPVSKLAHRCFCSKSAAKPHPKVVASACPILVTTDLSYPPVSPACDPFSRQNHKISIWPFCDYDNRSETPPGIDQTR